MNILKEFLNNFVILLFILLINLGIGILSLKIFYKILDKLEMVSINKADKIVIIFALLIITILSLLLTII